MGQIQKQADVTIAISRTSGFYVERPGDDSSDWKSLPPLEREVYHSRIDSIDKYERNIFSLRAGNNYVFEHAKLYLPFLRAITRKESFDRLVWLLGEHVKVDGRIICSSIMKIFEDTVYSLYFGIEFSPFASSSFKIIKHLFKDKFLIKRKRGREKKHVTLKAKLKFYINYYINYIIIN